MLQLLLRPCRVMRSILIILLFVCTVPALAEEFAAPDSSPAGAADSRAVDVEVDRRPFLSSEATWAGAALIVIIGGFLAAAVIGPIVRIEAPKSIPHAFSHHEDPAHHSGLERDARGEAPATMEDVE